MRTNVQFDDVKYVVKPKEGIIVCTINVDPQINDLYDMELGYKWQWFKSLLMANQWGKFTAKGVARCSKEDKFNEVLGKRIAEAKAKKMAFGIVHNLHKHIFDKLSKSMKEYANIIKGCEKASNTEKAHLEYLLKESEKGE